MCKKRSRKGSKKGIRGRDRKKKKRKIQGMIGKKNPKRQKRAKEERKRRWRKKKETVCDSNKIEKLALNFITKRAITSNMTHWEVV